MVFVKKQAGRTYAFDLFFGEPCVMEVPEQSPEEIPLIVANSHELAYKAVSCDGKAVFFSVREPQTGLEFEREFSLSEVALEKLPSEVRWKILRSAGFRPVYPELRSENLADRINGCTIYSRISVDCRKDAENTFGKPWAEIPERQRVVYLLNYLTDLANSEADYLGLSSPEGDPFFRLIGTRIAYSHGIPENLTELVAKYNRGLIEPGEALVQVYSILERAEKVRRLFFGNGRSAAGVVYEYFPVAFNGLPLNEGLLEFEYIYRPIAKQIERDTSYVAKSREKRTPLEIPEL